MNRGFIVIFTFLFCTRVFAQSDFQQLFDTEKAFAQAAAEKGMKPAFLEFLADDSVIFHPDAVKGREFWTSWVDASPIQFMRNLTYADIASNGLLGYTTGNWRSYPKGKSEALAEFGQYVTIWEKKQDGKFRASVDIGITHEKLSFLETNRVFPTDNSRDPNKRGWSAADASMNFLKMGMSEKALGGAYEKFAAKDVRLLLDGAPPILGKKNVVAATKHYISIEYPKKIALLESADMAYVWNPCEFADSNEGREKGNCLHIWKLRNEKWWIVLGILAPVPNETRPTLKIRQKTKKSQ